MNIKTVLAMPAMKNARMVAGQEGELREITGVNVLEATDIANWGRSGEVLLTSFFALQNASSEELETFFEKLHHIGISAVIIKIDRLVPHIPSKIIELCNTYQIPLVEIDRTVKYETIVLEILGPIINQNMNLLNKYHQVHSELTKLAMKMPSLDEILREFKKMIQRDVSLLNTARGTLISTNPLLGEVEVLSASEVQTEKYVHFKYERQTVLYKGLTPLVSGQQIRVGIPNLGYEDYELIIHELPGQVSAEDFMVIENGVKFLQMELLKKYVLSQNVFQQKNNLINDLLHDRLYGAQATAEVLEFLGISRQPCYQVMLLQLSPREGKKPTAEQLSRTLRKIRLKIKIYYPSIVFLEKIDTIIFILNFPSTQPGLKASALEKIMSSFEDNNVLQDFYYYLSLSSPCRQDTLPAANREVSDTLKVLRLFHNTSKILAYDELGIYKLFLAANTLDDLSRFIPPRLLAFHAEHPQLFDTLNTFLDTNQSYNLTAERLFLHTKTVRYRLDKVKKLLSIDFSNPEDLLQVQIAARLFKLTDGRMHHDES